MTTMAASEGDPRLDPHLRLTARRTRRGMRCCIHMLRRQPRLRVGPLQLLRRCNRSRTQVDAIDHHARLRGRSAALSASAAHGASNTPRHVLLHPHAAPPAPTDRRPRQRMRRRSRGRAQDATTAHDGRLSACCRVQSRSTARGAPDAPRSVVLRRPGPPPAPTARRPEAALMPSRCGASPIDPALDEAGFWPPDFRQPAAHRRGRKPSRGRRR